MSWLGWIFYPSEQNEATKVDDLEKVEVLCERINSSTLIEDKRKSLLELRELSENCKLEVGTRSLDIVLRILETYTHDRDITVLSLDILINIIKSDSTDSNEKNSNSQNLAHQFCEILLKHTKNIKILISLIDNQNFQIRWAVLKIFLVISKLELSKFQSILSEIHFGITRILDFLNESREMIRNDCIILLISLSLNDKNTQKILAFENIFQKLLEIIENEGEIEGGIVVFDCIVIMKNILINNDCTQKLFRELGFFPKFKSLFPTPKNINMFSSPLSTNKVNNLQELLGLFRSFLDPLTSRQSVASFQDSLSSVSIFESLLYLYSQSNLPESLLIEVILAVAEVIRSNEKNQKLFLQHLNRIYSNKSPLLTIFGYFINPKVSLSFKQAMLYLFQCLIHSNPTECDNIMMCLLPSAEFNGSSDLGRALCAGFFDYDSTLTWVSCTSLLHIMCNNSQCKKKLLQVYFSFDDSASINKTPISLIERCAQLLRLNRTSLQSKLNIISFIISWMIDCPEALDQFLKLDDAISLVISHLLTITNENDVLIHGVYAVLLTVVLIFTPSCKKAQTTEPIVVHVGLSGLKNFISALVQDSVFIMCSKSPRIEQSNNLCRFFDFEFTCIVKRIEVMLNNMIYNDSQQSLNITTAVKEISEKDIEIKNLHNKCSMLQEEIERLKLNLIEFERKESDYIKWEKMYHEMNEDFQKILTDHQNLIKHIDDQNTIIRNLTETLNSQQIIEISEPYGSDAINPKYNHYPSQNIYPQSQEEFQINEQNTTDYNEDSVPFYYSQYAEQE